METGDSVKAIADEIERLRGAEVSEDDLRFGKEAALLRFTLGLDNKHRALVAVASQEYYGLPEGAFEQYQKNLLAVTRADVQRVAKERLEPQKFTIAAVSNLTVFSKPLEPKGGATAPIDLTIPPRQAMEAAHSDTGSVELGKQLLRRAQQASGGAEKLAAVKDMTQTTVYTLREGGVDNETDHWIAPSHLRQEGVTTRNGTIVRYTDGTNGWISNGRASAGLNGPGLKHTLSDLLRVPVSLLLSDRVPGRTVNALDDRTVEITEQDRIARIVLDPETGLPATILYEAPVDQGPAYQFQEDLSNYRNVNGIQLPYAVHIIQNGLPFADGVTEYKLNQGLKPEVLQRRP
jgi:hypothetical protein